VSSVRHETAREGIDYTPETGELNFDANQSTQNFTIPIHHVSTNASESFYVLLDDPAGGSSIGISHKTLVTIQNPVSIPQEKILPITTVYQEQQEWCWIACCAMIFEYYHVPAVNSDFQCGIAGFIDFNWYTLSGPCSANCAQCAQVGAGSAQGIQAALQLYPEDAGIWLTRSYLNQTFTSPYPGIQSYEVGLYASPTTVINEINAGRPILAGISPNGLSPTGIAQHAVLIVGYQQVGPNLMLIVNDPFPFEAAATPNPYLAAGGINAGYLQYEISYGAFVQALIWSDSLIDIQPL